MSGTLGSWDSVKLCKPSLSPNIEYESRQVRGESWLILRNSGSGEHLRLNASASTILTLIDGNTSIETLCEMNERHGLTPEQIGSILGPLCASGLLSLGSAREQERLLAQYQTHKKNDHRSRFGNPLAIRIRLHNPDNWLGLAIAKVPWLFSRWFLVMTLCVIAFAVVATLVNGSVILAEFTRVASSPQHWWLYALLYPALKAIHELSHAAVIKRCGGSVHETGITFLVLMPVPYVDASDAWMFPAKSQRVLVGAAGMLAECALASIGLMIFLLVQPGIVRDIGFAMYVMGSISTLLFNANPLLKFDGYYILQDCLDIPNLSARSQKYCFYLAKKYLYRVQGAVSPVSAIGERRWLLTYGVLAGVYRCVITVVIALFLASQFLILGVALSVYAMFQLLINPILKLSRYLRLSPELTGVRSHSIRVTLGVACLFALFITLIPMPSSTRTEGVVWVPTQAQVFAAEDGLVEQLLIEPGAQVVAGQTLIRLQAPELLTAHLAVDAELEAARIQYRKLQQLDTVKAQSTVSDIQALELELAILNRRASHLEITAGIDGQFVVDEQAAVVGKHIKQGDLLAYVVNKNDLVVKAVLTQQRIERLQAGVEHTDVRLADRFEHRLKAELTRQTPAALNTLPSPALAYDGSSGIAVASQTNDQLRTLERVFHIELELPDTAAIAGIGGRAYVTLHHQPESLGRRWWRSTRQLLLKQLTV